MISVARTGKDVAVVMMLGRSESCHKAYQSEFSTPVGSGILATGTPVDETVANSGYCVQLVELWICTVTVRESETCFSRQFSDASKFDVCLPETHNGSRI